MPSNDPRPPDGSMPKSSPGAAWMVLALLVAGAIAAVILTSSGARSQRADIDYQPTFLQQLRQGNVESISSQGSTIKGTLRKPIDATASNGAVGDTTDFVVQVPAFADQQQLSSLLSEHDVRVRAQPTSGGGSSWGGVLEGVIPLLLIGAVVWWLFRRMGQNAGGAGAGGVSGFGRSRARRAEGKRVDTTFADVVGIDEAKADLTQIVEFLKDTKRYQRLGGRIPRGVLLQGEPGTGKTLLARAVAGEAGVPFFQISASEFVEMIVGVGAARVRDLFAKAKAEAPAIIFIDELDAIGRKRGASSGLGGSNDEREQTLNQILTEMDGFDAGSGVIVIAATNRPEILDPALLRPGRFDRRVAVAAPDRRGREKILEVHTKGKPLADEVELGVLARMTPGMVGADLANLCNEAALLAAEERHERITMDDFTQALERIVLGAERKTLLSEDDRRRIAYHEAGHAVVGMLTPLADPVRKVTITPRGRSLGVTLSAPDADQFNYERDSLLAKVKVALGGRVAEEIVFGSITTGAENDIQQLTRMVRGMVGRWGMSEAIGPIAVLPAEEERSPFAVPEVSPETQREVDREVRRIVEEAHGEVTELLQTNRERLESLARALLEHETLDEHEARTAVGLQERVVEPEPESQAEEAQAERDGRHHREEPRPADLPPAGIELA